MRSPLKGRDGWIVILIGVLAIDLLAADEQTLSEAVQRGAKDHPVVATAIVSATAAHLLAGGHPRYDKYDVFRVLGILRRFVARTTLRYP